MFSFLHGTDLLVLLLKPTVAASILMLYSYVLLVRKSLHYSNVYSIIAKC
uniref:Uncharacterized protein n=1 Tax=Arundo donax TaxID=35708 RepID=A0A0A8XZ94_ARUDO